MCHLLNGEITARFHVEHKFVVRSFEVGGREEESFRTFYSTRDNLGCGSTVSVLPMNCPTLLGAQITAARPYRPRQGSAADDDRPRCAAYVEWSGRVVERLLRYVQNHDCVLGVDGFPSGRNEFAMQIHSVE